MSAVIKLVRQPQAILACNEASTYVEELPLDHYAARLFTKANNVIFVKASVREGKMVKIINPCKPWKYYKEPRHGQA